MKNTKPTFLGNLSELSVIVKSSFFIVLLFTFNFFCINTYSQCWSKISAGGYQVLVINIERKLWAWGANYNGEFGNGTITGSYSFIEVACPVLSTANFEDTLSAIKVYPNPVKNSLTIQNSENLSIDKISVTDLTSKKVLEQKSISNTINFEKLQNEMYLLQITSVEKNAVTKFIKN